MKTFDLKACRDQLWHQLATATAQRAPDAVITERLTRLAEVDAYWAWPGRAVISRLRQHLEGGHADLLAQLAGNVWRALQAPRQRDQSDWAAPDRSDPALAALDRPLLREAAALATPQNVLARPAFEVLVLQPPGQAGEAGCRQQLACLASPLDAFSIDLVFVASAEEALLAVLANPDIQACVLPDSMPPASAATRPIAAAVSAMYAAHVQPLLATNPDTPGGDATPATAADQGSNERLADLARQLHRLRPELRLYRASSQPQKAAVAAPAQSLVDTADVIYPLRPFAALHAALQQGMAERFATPFFDALLNYSRRPRAVFHALPASRGSSLVGSPWAQDLLQFYGDNVFLAETSATQGGLDSLLEPSGVIRQAQALAAQAFGADHSFFVTNGTSSANKIVIQANLQPGDLVIVGADCHLSVTQAIAMCGAQAIFVTARPLPEHDLYGAVELANIKAVLLDLRSQGRLHRLKQLILTNSSFDGLVCDAERFMLDLLAIKPDLVFHWDEAWFAFAHFHPLYAGRNAMSAVRRIRQRLANADFRVQYARWHAAFQANGDPQKWQQPLLPDPDRVQLRVYATQSTHKTLSAFRQGSMIHVADDRFDAALFAEALRSHTSTSPNYQILASLDVARRQAGIEGYHRVRGALALALQLRRRIAESRALQPWFDVLDDAALLPASAQASTVEDRADAAVGALAALSRDWAGREWVVDPTRVTLNIRRSGLDGSALRRMLMDRYDIQVNKTSRHTVLFVVHIGSTQATVDHLLAVLHDLAARLISSGASMAAAGQDPAEPALPDVCVMHRAFVPHSGGGHPACELRMATQAGRTEAHVTHRTVAELLGASLTAPGEQPWVSAAFVTPYPPGFPLLLPGQLITPGVLRYLQRLHIKEIHGLCPERGLRVFRPEVLRRLLPPQPLPSREAGAAQPAAAQRERLHPARPTALAEV
jgi:arginine decarboxylase